MGSELTLPHKLNPNELRRFLGESRPFGRASASPPRKIGGVPFCQPRRVEGTLIRWNASYRGLNPEVD